MKTNVIIKGVFSAALLGVLLTSCKKNDTEDTDTSASSDNATAEAYFNDMGNIANEGAMSGNVSSYKTSPSYDGLLSACATVTFDTINHSDDDSVTVDFGTTNCLCNDGRYRRGKVLITHTGNKKYRDSLAIITTVPVNYYVNDNQLLGTRTVTNMGHNTSGNLYYNISVSGQVKLANNGGTITWNSTRQREWIAGESTTIWSDDIYSITGSANGTSAKGVSYTATITSPLIRNMSLGCRKHFTQGTFDLTPQGKPTRTVDFGTGACDNKATVTINGKTYNITLK